MAVFLPFSKHDYVNEWSDRIKVDPKYGDVVSFIQYSSKLAGYDIPKEKVSKPIKSKTRPDGLEDIKNNDTKNEMKKVKIMKFNFENKHTLILKPFLKKFKSIFEKSK